MIGWYPLTPSPMGLLRAREDGVLLTPAAAAKTVAATVPPPMPPRERRAVPARRPQQPPSTAQFPPPPRLPPARPVLAPSTSSTVPPPPTTSPSAGYRSLPSPPTPPQPPLRMTVSALDKDITLDAGPGRCVQIVTAVRGQAGAIAATKDVTTDTCSGTGGGEFGTRVRTAAAMATTASQCHRRLQREGSSAKFPPEDTTAFTIMSWRLLCPRLGSCPH